MLPLDKNKQIIQQINRIVRRGSHIQEVKTSLFEYILKLQQLYSQFSQKIHDEMTVFEQKILKNSFYSTEKSNYIINMSKIYRQYFSLFERHSKVNLMNIERIKPDQIMRQQEKLKNKCNFFIKQFQQYITTEQAYNISYRAYDGQCQKLDEMIQKFQTYSEPLRFYNQVMTHQYLKQLDKRYEDCTNNQTKILTEIQVLDQKRKWLSQNIKEVKQTYVFLLHNHLVAIESAISSIVDPKEDRLDRNQLNLRAITDTNSQHHTNQLKRLEEIYSNQNIAHEPQNDIFSEFSELFPRSSNQNEISSNQKLFYDRVEAIRNKKLKSLEEAFNIQKTLVEQLSIQKRNNQNFEKQFKIVEKEVFKSNGIGSFKKLFRKYFGSNFYEINELCLIIIQKQKKSLEKIAKSLDNIEQKLKKILRLKKQNILIFEKRSKIILDEHLELKDKINEKRLISEENSSKFKQKITSSFNEFKKIFKQMEESQRQNDKMFFTQLKGHYQTILKQAINKTHSRTIQKEKNRVNILKTFDINNQIILILKEDTRYQMLINQNLKPNLYLTFQSKIKKQQFDRTKRILQKKQTRLKSMLVQKMSCCGMKSEIVKQDILSTHECKLITDKKIKGILKISTLGVIFEERSFNPFAQIIQITLPQNDIISFDIKSNPNDKKNRQNIQIVTQMGQIVFESSESPSIIQSMQKNITFKIQKQGSERDRKQKRNDSSLFLKNNTSTQFRVSYYHGSQVLNGSGIQVSKVPTQQKQSSKKTKSNQNPLQSFLKVWKQEILFSNLFIPVIKNVPIQSNSRRDYSYKQGHSKFYLKQKKEQEWLGQSLKLQYDWKISFPDSPMLYSFKHHQTVKIELLSKQLTRITIIEGKYSQEQLYTKNKFYKQIQEMNKVLVQLIVGITCREAQVIMVPQNQQNQSIDYNIVLDEINLDEKQTKFEKSENAIRNSKLIPQRLSNISANTTTK